MLRKSGIRPMPSGSSRQTSSVMPGRMVGLTMPTTPRQLENDILIALRTLDVVPAKAGTHNHSCLMLSPILPILLFTAYGAPPSRGRQVERSRRTIVVLRRFVRHIAFGQIAGNGGGVALAGIAVAPGARALQQEALARLHLDTRRG